MASSSPTPLSILDTAKLTFAIDDFASLDREKYSGFFKAPTLPQYTFRVCIIPKNNLYSHSSGHKEILFNLWFHSEGKPHVSVQYRVSILDATGRKHLTKEHLWNCTSKGNMLDYSINRLIKREYLLKCANCLLPDGKLTVYVEVDVLSDKIPHFPIPEPTLHSTTITSKLEDSNIQKDFESLLENGKLSNVVLVVGKREFNVHKAILAARSKVFGAMFENKETKESMENRVEIPDLDEEVFEELLVYIYTGKIPKTDKNALELFVAADKYQLDHLKSICEQTLSTSLTTESVVSTLMVADMHGAVDLKCKCIEYITEHSDKVRATNGWSQFVAANRFELLNQLFEAMSVKFTCGSNGTNK